MAVEVTISDWADVVVGVKGDSFDIERRSLADRLFWPALLVLVTGGAVLAAVLVRKVDNGVVLVITLVAGVRRRDLARACRSGSGYGADARVRRQLPVGHSARRRRSMSPTCAGRSSSVGVPHQRPAR